MDLACAALPVTQKDICQQAIESISVNAAL